MAQSITSTLSFINADMFSEYTAYSPYIVALVVCLGTFLILKFVQLVVVARMKVLASRTTNDIDDVFVDIASHIKPDLYTVIAIYVGLQPLSIPLWIETTVEILLILSLARFFIRGILRLLDYGVTKYVAQQEEEVGEQQAEHTEAMMKIFRAVLLTILWVSVCLFILSNQGVNITSLIASLGIGGIAVALALQNVLGDLFASFSIFLDAPFKVGDYIKFGDKDGVVEKIGIRSTRVRTLLGEQLVVPNKQLISSEIQNFRRMERRREVLKIGTVYQLSGDVITRIPSIIQEVVASVDGVTFDRSHFSGFGDSALVFETVYYVDSAEYLDYMNAKQEVNNRLFVRFEREGIGFAYPTQTVHISK